MTAFKPKGDNPFNPGAGRKPPLLAGRDDELGLFKNEFGRMKRLGQGFAAVMYAPRGMGKTVLMRRLRDEIAEEDPDAVFVITYPDGDDEIPMPDLERLLPADAPAPDQKTLQKHGGLNAGVRAAVSVTETWRCSDKERRALYKERLRQACANRPAALVIDEAHRLKDGDRVELLNMAQDITEDGQFLFILTGTPGLVHPISKRTTFAARFKKISLGMLSEDAAMAALREPLAKGGIAIDDGLLRHAVAQSHCYPYFIQLWGGALWDCAAGHGVSRLTEEHARAVAAVVNGERLDYYDGRFEEIRKSRALHAAAAAVADAYQHGGQYDKDGVSKIINIALERRIPDEDERWEKAEAMINELVALGYIWRPAGQPFMEVGIPSLMDYIAQRRPRQQPPLPPAEAKRISMESRERQSGGASG